MAATGESSLTCESSWRGYGLTMEETPICASVERDLDIDVDELTSGAATAPAPAPVPVQAPVQAPAQVPVSASQARNAADQS